MGKEEKIEKRKLKEETHEIKIISTNLLSDDLKECLRRYAHAGGRKKAFGKFKGKVVEMSDTYGTCLKDLYVEFKEGKIIVKGKEDHVWIVNDEEIIKRGIKIGDCIEFNALVHAYTRKDGVMNYGLKCPENIKKISHYNLPSETELAISMIGKMGQINWLEFIPKNTPVTFSLKDAKKVIRFYFEKFCPKDNKLKKIIENDFSLFHDDIQYLEQKIHGEIDCVLYLAIIKVLQDCEVGK